VTRLGYDSNTINVIPNSEEKVCLIFEVHQQLLYNKIYRYIKIYGSQFIKNLITPGFEKFRYTAKYFSTQDMSLVTRKGVYPYEYTDNWNKLEETSLPSKEDFYSTLKESHII